MRTREFLNRVDHQTVLMAIKSAEKKTSGEIRVFVSHKEIADPVAAAKSQFVRLGMHNTREHNGVLLFVAPRSQTFAILGDRAIHERCGEGFWKQLTEELSTHFKKSDFTGGLVHGIQKAGRLLAEHFPRRPDDQNELPDAVAHD